ncbi:helix-turn-helix domain-containing protein [Pedobacter nutrimenti]|jgi:DNA-binding HxlR family transcriptional regulator|uniref:winged helix-turn-helix transcriptional regulator n=1 Tax=Pedobacter nutrimenti TaxID=1241337 RepID=UPI00292F9F23|nr:helix-turn-helix domain-containing protein [Pedobacter nutrimenti]
MKSDCPLNFGLELFGDRWTLLIIRDMIFFNKRSYNEFLSSAEHISTNILANRLNFLEKEKFIIKERDRDHKQKMIYSLTEKGIGLVPLIIEIGLWSDRYAEETLTVSELVNLNDFKTDWSKALRALQQKLYHLHLQREI